MQNLLKLLNHYFTQEREEPTGRGQAFIFLEESLLSSQSSSVGHVRTGRPDSDQFRSLISSVRGNPRRGSENEQIKILLERQEEQILASGRAEIQKHYQTYYDRRSIPKLNGSNLKEVKLIVLIKEKNNFDEINNFFINNLLEQHWDLRETHEKKSQ